ncbi:hypothetical protein AB8F64_22080, partial [Salmonella enterica]
MCKCQQKSAAGRSCNRGNAGENRHRDMAPGDELLALQFAVVVGCLTGEQYAACSLYVYARSAWERSDTTAQYCAGF